MYELSALEVDGEAWSLEGTEAIVAEIRDGWVFSMLAGTEDPFERWPTRDPFSLAAWDQSGALVLLYPSMYIDQRVYVTEVYNWLVCTLRQSDGG